MHLVDELAAHLYNGIFLRDLLARKTDDTDLEELNERALERTEEMLESFKLHKPYFTRRLHDVEDFLLSPDSKK